MNSYWVFDTFWFLGTIALGTALVVTRLQERAQLFGVLAVCGFAFCSSFAAYYHVGRLANAFAIAAFACIAVLAVLQWRFRKASR